MRKAIRTILMVSFMVFATQIVCAESGKLMPEPYKGSDAFERIKLLEGNWQGTHKMGEEVSEAVVTYEITSNASAVVETLFPGTPHEMVSVYHDEDGELNMTHYCAFGNQPKMELINANANEIVLEFNGQNTIDPTTENHMHGLTIAFKEDGSIEHNWTMYQEGQESGKTIIQLTRTNE